MKRQRNTTQMKEQIRNTEVQINEEEIGKLPEKEFRIMIVCYAKSLQSCPTLCDPIDGSLPGSPVPWVLQARTLEWVAISFSSAWKWKVKVKSLSHVWLLATPWTAAYQAPPSMGFFQARVLEWGAIAFSRIMIVKIIKKPWKQNGENVRIN